MLKVKNNGARTLLPNGTWLERGAEISVPASVAKLLAFIEKDIEIIPEAKKKKK